MYVLVDVIFAKYQIFQKMFFSPILMLFHLNVREDIVELVSDASLPLPVFLSIPRQAHRSP